MKNKYEIRGDVTAIIINSPKYGKRESLISTSKLERAKEFSNTWYVNYKKDRNTLYVQGHMAKVDGKQETALLHRWLMNAPDGMQVDHRNHDGLINTDDNLRICTNAENQQNGKGAYKNSESGIRGVSWDNKSKKWRVQVGVKGKKINLGRFDDILEAEKVVKEARVKLMPYSQDAM